MVFEQTSDTRAFEFTGSAKEWFGIWIVNLLLSIVTIGIYSAWAKVRTKKYFYRNTHVEGRNFDYHATGGQILKGRLIVIAAIICFQIILALLPVIGLILLIALIFFYPWLLIRAMIFNANVSSFSNVRFNFNGTYGQGFKVYLFYPILCALTAYTTLPILDRTMKRFSINNHRLGTATFEMNAGIGAFYKAAFLALLWVISVFVIAIFGMGLSFVGFGEDILWSLEKNDPTLLFSIMGVFYAVFFIGFIPAPFIYQAFTRNEVYNTTLLKGGHRLRSNVSAPQLIWIAVSNLVVVVFTGGLMLPWAQIRIARYLADHTAVDLGGSVDDFVGQQEKATSALGDAYTDIEGIDVGLPV